MSKNKENLKKKPKKSDIIDYEMITIDENITLRAKRDTLIQRIWNTQNLIADINSHINEIKKNEDAIKEWKAYLSCDQIPKPFEPQKIRNFFEKTLHYEMIDAENTTNWLLSVDECSILNQDIDAPNMTRDFLKEGRIDFGHQYDIRINDAIEIINRMDVFLKGHKKNITKEVVEDITQLMLFAQNKVVQYIDNFTYRVLSSEAAYMEPITVTTAEYYFEGTNFEIHIWIFQNVPIYLNEDEANQMLIDLEHINILLKIPYSVLIPNMVIRGVHCHFDHLSPLTRYFNLPMFMNDGIEKNLKMSLRREWVNIVRIQSEVKEYMIKERAEYEESLRLRAEAEEQKAKEEKSNQNNKENAKKKEKNVVIRKFSREPPIVAPNEVPIVNKDFILQDEKQYADAISRYNPIALDLTIGEVNLRKYQILGGVYHINSLSKPRSTNFPKLIMTWYTPNKQVECKRATIDADRPKWGDSYSNFFEITIHLEDCFCQWGEPVACCFDYYPEVKSKDEDILETDKNLNVSTPVIINDFNLHELFTKRMMYDFIEHTIPRTISSFNFPGDFDYEKVEKKTKSAFGGAKISEKEEKQLEYERQLLSFNLQTNPERLFPFFKKVLPIIVLPNKETTNEETTNKQTRPYEYFSDFMSAVESIKASYQKTTFINKSGEPVKIVVKDYAKSPRALKLAAYEEAEKKEEVARLSLKSQSLVKGLTKAERAARKAQNLAKKQSMIQTKLTEEPEKPISKWSTSNVLKSVYNESEKKITIWTDRLGIFGMAYNRYEHFPFKKWSIQPFEENPHELELIIESPRALFRIYITKDGYKAFISDFSKTSKSRKIYLEITEPISELRIFKTKLQEKCLNIFPEPDAVWYVDGLFCQKHLAAELHTYDCMSISALTLKYLSTNWNKLAKRRIMILAIEELKQMDTELSIIQITPEEVKFVEIKEKVIVGAENVELECIPTWRNLEWYPDIHQLIKSNFHASEESHFKDESNVAFYLKELLHSVRLLSYS